MFRKALKEKLEGIFGFEKTTYNAPSVEDEQNVLFIEINEARSRISQGKALCRVEGFLVVYAELDRLPFGFFSKRIEQSDSALTKDLFFFDIDTNVEKNRALVQDISERRTKFVFLYEEQYDPNKGNLTELEFEE